MTNIEALKANVSQVHGLVISENAFIKVCIDSEITQADEYTKENQELIDLATVKIYRQILYAPNFREGDVNYSQSQGIKDAIDNLLSNWGYAAEFGMRPTVKGVSPW